MELDLLGEQLVLAFRFQKSGFDPELTLEDEVTNETVPAKTLFFQSERRWFMRGESIPGHLGVKAIAVDADSLYLETAPLRPAAVEEAIVERMLPLRIASEGQDTVIVDTTTEQILIRIGEPTKPAEMEEELGERCLWTIPTKDLSEVRRRAVIGIADLAFTIDAYDVAPLEVESSPVTSQAAAQRITLQLQVGLQMRLQMEQRPILSLRTRMSDRQVMTGRTELQQVMALNQALACMAPEQIEQFFTRYVAEHGEKKALSVAVFVLAGKVKRVRPDLTWRAARRAARKLISRVA